LAITQVLVETLVVVLFMFVVYKLPKFRQFSSRRVIIFDAIFAGIIGLLMTLLVLKAKAIQLAPPLSERYAEWSYLLAKGKNVVNVILVDFRALDTLGEITVLTIAALGIFALMSGLSGRKKHKANANAGDAGSPPEPNTTENS
jgi:multicomponent Na+:H+ antiporter subunit A